MNVEVTKDNVIISEDSNQPHQEEYKITRCYFTFDEYVGSCENKVAVFTIMSTKESHTMDILDNECEIPNEVLKHEYDTVKLGVYGYDVETIDNEEVLKLRYSPSYTTFVVSTGSYVEGAKSPEMITPTQYELYSNKLQEGLDTLYEAVQETENLNIEAEKEGKITTITITKKDGTSYDVDLEDGMGLNYNWQGTSLGIKREDESVYQYVDLQGQKGEPGAIKFEIVEELPTQDIKDDTIYLVPYDKLTVQELPSIGLPHTIYIVESTSKRYVYESNQWIEITSNNQYVEYIYVNNSWEELGNIGVDVDLSNYYTKSETYSKQETNTLLGGKQDTLQAGTYITISNENVIDVTGVVRTSGQDYIYGNKYFAYLPTTNETNTPTSNNQLVPKKYVDDSIGAIQIPTKTSDLTNDSNFVSNTDYATASTGGVAKVNSYYGVDVYDGVLIGATKNYSTYESQPNSTVICKGTLENVINGKGLVSNVDYASDNTAGTIKTGWEFGTAVNSSGKLYAAAKNYTQYTNSDNSMFISKYTLENVITGKDLTTKAYVDSLVGNVETLLTTLDIGGGISGN